MEHRKDLREVYLHIYDVFASDVTEVANLHKSWNTRYARELLGTLQHAGLVILTEDGTGSEAYQVDPSSDDITREEAEAKFDEWAGVETPAPTSATSARASSAKATSREPHDCLCGCGEVITTRSLYRPGHDARHAGQVGREVAAIRNGGHDEGDQITIDTLYAMLPSEALQAKAKRIADKIDRKNLDAAKPDPTCVEGIIKVGKNEVPGRKWSGGTVEYLSPKTKEWMIASKTAAHTFQEG